MSADSDLLAFLLEHGDFVSSVLWQHADMHPREGDRARSAARDLDWLIKVNSRDWTHDIHSDDCMSDDWEERRRIMTPQTIEVNHRLHMGDVRRIEEALRSRK